VLSPPGVPGTGLQANDHALARRAAEDDDRWAEIPVRGDPAAPTLLLIPVRQLRRRSGTRTSEVYAMTASAVGTELSRLVPTPRVPADAAPSAETASTPRGAPAAVSYQRVFHQLARRELRLLGDLATWAPADEPERTAALTAHAELIGRVLLHHHAVERDLVWPALRAAVPADRGVQVRATLDDWTARCARIDHMLRDVSTAARQWSVSASGTARDTFAMACLELADAIDAHTVSEERVLLPLLAEHVGADAWAEITRAGRCRLSGREQLLVLGLALEDSCAADRARLLDGLSASARMAWRLHGRRSYRAAVVRLRGAPPAA